MLLNDNVALGDVPCTLARGGIVEVEPGGAGIEVAAPTMCCRHLTIDTPTMFRLYTLRIAVPQRLLDHTMQTDIYHASASSGARTELCLTYRSISAGHDDAGSCSVHGQGSGTSHGLNVLRHHGRKRVLLFAAVLRERAPLFMNRATVVAA